MILKPLYRQLKPLTGRPESTCSASNVYLLCTMQHKSVTMKYRNVWNKNVIIRNTHYIQLNIWKGKHSSQNQTGNSIIHYASLKIICILQYQNSVRVFTLLTVNTQFIKKNIYLLYFNNFRNSYSERISVNLRTNAAFM
jgi:hypothetical protein